jgi:hypothetical protein
MVPPHKPDDDVFHFVNEPNIFAPVGSGFVDEEAPGVPEEPAANDEELIWTDATPAIFKRR